jgi:hypothetical protein
MSLWIKLFTNFYTHRKTVRLQCKIGFDALWIPPRLWAYCAENQPDGNLANYSVEEVARILDYRKNAKTMVDALIHAGFLDPDPLRIHGWDEHNSFHATYSERARKAAESRWSNNNKALTDPRSKNGDLDQRLTKQSSSNASSITPEQIYKVYPHRVGKPKALKAIANAIGNHGAEHVLKATQAFAELWMGSPLDFCPHPATWFNQERYNDEPHTWKRADGKHQEPLLLATPKDTFTGEVQII